MQQKSELPEGWAEAVLDDIGKWSTGGTPSRKIKEYFGGDIPWVKSGDLNDSIVTDTEEKITKNGLDNSSAKLLPGGTVSVALYGATIGKLGILNIDAATNQACANCQVNSQAINRMFLFYYLHSQREELIKAGQGGAQPNITNGIVRNWPITLPPLPEQHRIVSAIEALFARLDATNEKLDSVLEILKKFRESVLAAACDGRLTEEWRGRNPEVEDFKISITDYCKKTESKKKNKSLNYEEEEIHLAPEMWATEYLENFIDIAGRIGWKGLKAEEYREEGPLLLSAHNLSSSKYVDFTSANHLSEERYFESPEIMLKNNDILLVKDGSGIGKIGIVNDLPQEATVNSSLLVIRSPEIIVTDFLYYQLSGPEMQNIVRQRITGSATPHLFQKDIKKFLIKIPPLPEQQEIVRRVDALFAFADSIETKVTVARDKTEKLRQSILAKAFSGQLVETEAEIAKREGRDYETAEVLLEKIKAEKGIKDKKK